MNRKFSRQRESIKRNIMERRDHPTADMVFADIRKEYPNVSLGTVYRNLSLFADLGEIRKIPSMHGPDRFDGNMTPHYHFICQECGGIQDLVLTGGVSEEVLEDAAGQVSGMITGCSMTFHGICDRCAEKQTS